MDYKNQIWKNNNHLLTNGSWNDKESYTDKVLERPQAFKQDLFIIHCKWSTNSPPLTDSYLCVSGTLTPYIWFVFLVKFQKINVQTNFKPGSVYIDFKKDSWFLLETENIKMKKLFLENLSNMRNDLPHFRSKTF